jgi:hypothetical protein
MRNSAATPGWKPSSPPAAGAIRVILERASVDPEYARIKEDLYRAGSAPLRTILQDAKARGDLPARFDTDSAIDRLVGPVMYRHLFAMGPITDGWLAELVDAFLAGHPGIGGQR